MAWRAVLSLVLVGLARAVGLGGLSLTLRDGVYRAIFLVLVTQGVIFGGQAPFLSLWARDALGADAVGVGLLQAVGALVAVAFGLAFGLRSDRTGRRTAWMLAAYVVAIPARLGLPLVTQFWAGVALSAVAGMGTFSLLFALLGDWLRYRQPVQSAQIHSTVRLAFALGWQVGAVGASLLVTAFGYGGLFFATAALQTLTVGITLWGVRDAPNTVGAPAVMVAPNEADAAPLSVSQVPPERLTLETPVRPSRPVRPTGRLAPHRALLFYLICILFVGAASTARMSFLPLYLTEHLHVVRGAVGPVFAVEALYEMPFFLLLGRLADRYGVSVLLPFGLLAGAAYYSGIALSSSYGQIIALELLFAVLIASTNNLGIIYVQDLLPRRGGTALAFYNAASRLGPLLAAPALGYLVQGWGWASAYFTASALILTATGLFLLSSRTARVARA